MYTREALLDIHDRSHRSLSMLLDHCRGLDDEQLNRELDGFGYPTVRSQLHHIISAAVLAERHRRPDERRRERGRVPVRRRP
ncbi:MAG: hypothetical protein ACFHWZ_18795 [Phycisphaerales bacterium]